MIQIEINGDKHNLSDIQPGRINEQVRKRQDDGVAVCLRVYVQQNNVDVVLSCGDCGSSSGRGGRRANPDEEKIFSLWDKFGCKEKPINPGKVIAFLNQIK